MLKGSSFFSSVVSTTAASLVLMICGLVTGSLTARILGSSGRGELALIQMYGTLFATFSIVGLPATVTYFTGKDPANAGSYFLTGIFLVSLISVPLALVAYLAMPYFLVMQGAHIIAAAQIYLLYIPLYMVTGFCLASVQGQMRMNLWNFMRIFAAAGWMLPLCWLYLTSSADAVWFSKVYLGFLIVCALVFLWFTFAEFQEGAAVRKKFIAPMSSYAVPTYIAVFFQQSNLRIDQIIISLQAPPELLGLYVVALAWSAAHTPISTAVTYVLVPYLARLQNQESQGCAFGKVARISLMVNISMAVLMMAVTPLAVRLIYGEQFLSVISISYILIMVSVLSNMKLVFAECLRGIGHPNIVMKAEIVGLLVSSILFLFALGVFGLAGVAVASGIGYASTFVLLLRYVSNIYKIPSSSLLVPLRSDWIFIFDRIMGAIYGYIKSR